MIAPNDFSLNKKEIICDVCHKIFKRGKDLKSHVVIHLDKKPFCCTVCSEAFKRKASLKRHLLIHSGEKPFVCQICDKSFRQKGSLNEHSLTHTGEKPHSCEICKLGFTTKSNYVRHLRKHMSTKSFICVICEKGFNVRSHLMQHYEKAHQSKYKKEYRTVDKRVNDDFVVNVDKTERQIDSNVVSENYSSSRTTDLHLEFFTKKATNSLKDEPSHSQDRFTCNYCGSSFTQNENLQKHLKTHSEKDSTENGCCKEIIIESKQMKSFQSCFTCFVCDKSYKKENDYIQHSLIHKIPGPFECDICVGETQFKNLCELHKHYIEHDDNVCLCFFCRDLCEKNNYNINLDYNSTYFKCNVCYMSFKDSIFLKTHSSYHKKHKPYVVKL